MGVKVDEGVEIRGSGKPGKIGGQCFVGFLLWITRTEAKPCKTQNLPER